MNYELKMILEKIEGDFICVYDTERKKFSSKEEFEKVNWKWTVQFPLSVYRMV